MLRKNDAAMPLCIGAFRVFPPIGGKGEGLTRLSFIKENLLIHLFINQINSL
jgi:hypothetical protein